MASSEIKFDIADDLIQKGVTGVYLVIRGVQNKLEDPRFEEYKDRRLQELLQSTKPDFVENDPILKGYRDLHTAFGFSNRNFPAAPETLYINLLKYQRLVHINLLVDVYNLVSLETRLALGAHDLGHVVGNIHLRPMCGDEQFWPLGSEETKKVREGGYSYIDDANDVLCMLDSRQVEKSKVTETTREAFYILQGNKATSSEYLLEGAQKLIHLTQEFCGGEAAVLYSPS